MQQIWLYVGIVLTSRAVVVDGQIVNITGKCAPFSEAPWIRKVAQRMSNAYATNEDKQVVKYAYNNAWPTPSEWNKIISEMECYIGKDMITTDYQRYKTIVSRLDDKIYDLLAVDSTEYNSKLESAVWDFKRSRDELLVLGRPSTFFAFVKQFSTMLIALQLEAMLRRGGGSADKNDLAEVVEDVLFHVENKIDQLAQWRAHDFLETTMLINPDGCQPTKTCKLQKETLLIKDTYTGQVLWGSSNCPASGHEACKGTKSEKEDRVFRKFQKLSDQMEEELRGKLSNGFPLKEWEKLMHGTEMTGVITASDEVSSLCADGTNIPVPNSRRWDAPGDVTLPRSTTVIGFKASTSGSTAGVMASFDGGRIFTNSSWKCTISRPKAGWCSHQFDDSAWKPATEYKANDGIGEWSVFPSNAVWIWMAGNRPEDVDFSDTIWCRRRLRRQPKFNPLSGQNFSLLVTADVEVVAVCADGQFLAEDRAFRSGKKWRQADTVSVPSNATVLGIEAKENAETRGILASTADGSVKTDSQWRCTSKKPPRDWCSKKFDDRSWKPAVEDEANDGWFWPRVAGIETSARWIWAETSGNNYVDRAWCRRKLEHATTAPVSGYGFATADNDLVQICIDGKHVASIASRNASNWKLADRFAVPPSSDVIGIEAHDRGGVAGLLASFPAGGRVQSTDSTWKCTGEVPRDGWCRRGFNLKGWESATEIEMNNGRGAHKSVIERIPQNAKWIWTAGYRATWKNYDKRIWCRREI